MWSQWCVLYTRPSNTPNEAGDYRSPRSLSRLLFSNVRLHPVGREETKMWLVRLRICVDQWPQMGVRFSVYLLRTFLLEHMLIHPVDFNTTVWFVTYNKQWEEFVVIIVDNETNEVTKRRFDKCIKNGELYCNSQFATEIVTCSKLKRSEVSWYISLKCQVWLHAFRRNSVWLLVIATLRMILLFNVSN